MFICAEYLKMPHCEFKKLPLQEQLKWLIYCEEEAKQKKKEYDKMKEDTQMQKLKAESKKTPSPGVRRKG